MKWFQVKEKSAGKKRLFLCWYLYCILGKYVVRIIAFFVALFTYILNKDLQVYSAKYFKVLFEYTSQKKYKPSTINQFKHVLSYAYSLVDKMQVFGNKYNPDYIHFDNSEAQKLLFEDIEQGKGVFFICNHIGNVEIMRALLQSKTPTKKPKISIFLQKNQCLIFNDFINAISKNNNNISTYPIEEIDISTAIEIENKLSSGEIVFMAGDRVPVNNENKTSRINILGKPVDIPIGVFKFAQMVHAEIYFISCLQSNKGYTVYLSKNYTTDISTMMADFSKFLTEMILKSPYQFYHFYDIFK